jgi:hypothetical protein
MTNLRSALDRYLTMRKGLGYKYEHQTRRLTHFVVFMEKCRPMCLGTALRWSCCKPASTAP